MKLRKHMTNLHNRIVVDLIRQQRDCHLIGNRTRKFLAL